MNRKRITWGAACLLVFWGIEASAQGVDDPRVVSTWTSYWDMSNESFTTRLNELRDKNERPVDLEVYQTEDGGMQYSAVWYPNTDNRGWACFRNMTSDEFNARWEKYTNMGYRTVDIEINNIDGELSFAGIWEENKAQIDTYCWWNMTEETWGEKFREHSADGYRLKDVEVYADGDAFKYAAIWVKDGETLDWKQFNHLTYDELNQKFNQYREEGYRISDIESYETAEDQRYAAIWVKNGNDRGWAVWWNLDADLHFTKWDEYRNDKYRPVQIVGYPVPNGKRFAAIYRDNSEPE